LSPSTTVVRGKNSATHIVSLQGEDKPAGPSQLRQSDTPLNRGELAGLAWRSRPTYTCRAERE